MQNYTSTIEQIVGQVRQTQSVQVLQPPAVGRTTRRNELLMFAKPEIFMVENPDHSSAALDMIFRKLNEFNAEVSGVILVSGKALEDAEIMNRHYGFINEMSRRASEAVSADDRAKIERLLGVSLDEYRVYGGHEFLKSDGSYTPQSRNELWQSRGKTSKVRGGFYVQAFDTDGEKFVLVNAFHPVQLSHFTEPSRRIALMLVHSDTDWSTLRNDLIGATDPEKAAAGSIRRTLYESPARYGFDSVGIGNNGVHLSAGPYEGAFEILNFLGRLVNFDVQAQPPLIIRKLQDAGLSLEQALAATTNPTIQKDGKTTDLFGATEDVNTEDAVALYVQAVKA